MKYVRHLKGYDIFNDRELHRLDVIINGEMLVVHVPIYLPASASEIEAKITEAFTSLVERVDAKYELKLTPAIEPL